jgi:cytochrome c
MKKALIVLGISAVMFSACGGGGKSGSADSSAAAKPDSASAVQRSVDTTNAGGKLIAKNDCLTCHKIDTKVIGPSYADVAAKYPANEANIDTLANKVIKGGSGHWGAIAMAGHPSLSEADAKSMVTYILSLKK